MRALTLTQPWAGLVASGIKLVENRPRRMIKQDDFGKRFAIHASREIDDEVVERIYEIAPEIRPEPAMRRWYPLSRITSAAIAVATVDYQIERNRDGTLEEPLDVPPLLDQARWFFGPIGYVLRDVIVLPTPVPCRGWQGFWTLSPDVERAVVEQLGERAA